MNDNYSSLGENNRRHTSGSSGRHRSPSRSCGGDKGGTPKEEVTHLTPLEVEVLHPQPEPFHQAQSVSVRKRGQKRGQFLILVTPRPASAGDTRDGSDKRVCPSLDTRRSTPPSSSSPTASAPPKPPSLNPPWKRAVYPRSKAKISNRSFRIQKSFPNPVSVS